MNVPSWFQRKPERFGFVCTVVEIEFENETWYDCSPYPYEKRHSSGVFSKYVILLKEARFNAFRDFSTILTKIY